MPDKIEAFFQFCTKLKIPISGLMCIPPIMIHLVFIFIFKQIIKKLNLNALSMGMTSDFEEAIKFGSTCIRIGEGFWKAYLKEQMSAFRFFVFK